MTRELGDAYRALMVRSSKTLEILEMSREAVSLVDRVGTIVEGPPSLLVANSDFLELIRIVGEARTGWGCFVCRADRDLPHTNQCAIGQLANILGRYNGRITDDSAAPNTRPTTGGKTSGQT